MRDRIEIVEIGLDEEFLKEIEKEQTLSRDVQIKIKGHLEGLKKQTATKKNIRQKK